MLTDWVLIARLARELQNRLRGARVTGAGVLPDGRVAVAVRSRGESLTMAVDAFGSPPLVTVERADLPPAAEPGFARALADALRGTVLTGVHARRGDRLLRLEFATRSRFGVESALELFVELVPRFGNVVLAKGGTVVAAAKEFSHSENAAREVRAGGAYALPPLPPPGTRASGPAELPDVLDAPLYVYRRDGDIVAAHVTPLHGSAGAESRESSLLDVFARVREQRLRRGERERVARRVAALVKRLDSREAKLRDELGALGAKYARIEERDALAREGERIFATLHERAESERDDAKERAAELFAQYKKLGASRPHVERRERDVRAQLASIEDLRWEVERAGAEDLDDVEAAVASVDPRRGGGAPAARRRKRAPLQWLTGGGSRITVGRNPLENAELTFKLARPNDLWFHAQGIPGAHVVLARDDRTPPPPEDLEAAASAAAFYSKARASASVPVDYTLRKFVRKQRDAAPGLVWYTQPKTILASPKPPPV